MDFVRSHFGKMKLTSWSLLAHFFSNLIWKKSWPKVFNWPAAISTPHLNKFEKVSIKYVNVTNPWANYFRRWSEPNYFYIKIMYFKVGLYIRLQNWRKFMKSHLKGLNKNDKIRILQIRLASALYNLLFILRAYMVRDCKQKIE